jgi:cobalamin biosynthesis protein CobD
MGWWLGIIEQRLNKPSLSFQQRKVYGVVGLFFFLFPVFCVTFLLTFICSFFSFGFVVLAVLSSSLIAQRSLFSHVRDVARAFNEGLPAARYAVSMIVGRETKNLDEAGISRAAVESLAENYSDGVVAPLFWLCFGGLTGGALYKASNTADSMIGHKNEQFEAFGWAAARFDDLLNLPCSRLAALWLVLAAFFIPGASARNAVSAIRKDAASHRSPNAGWPESALAGALGFKLGGPRHYGAEEVDGAYMGSGRYELNRHDLEKSLKLYIAACLIQLTVIGLSALSLWFVL